MTVINEKFTVNTQGFTDIIDITQKVKHAVYNHSLQSAVVHVYVAGSTVSITNIEFEPGLLVDLPEALEKIASDYEGVDKAYAIQAGREVRVMVIPEKVSDNKCHLIAHDIKERIEKELTYPGQIKVTVIRELRANELAR